MFRFLSKHKEITQLKTANARFESFLRSLPMEYCGWNDGGIQAISKGFTRLLNVKKVDNIDDIKDALNPSDAAALEGLYDNLSKNGKDFSLTTSIFDGSKTINLIARQGSFGDGDYKEKFNVIWLQDMTNIVKSAQKTMELLEDNEKKVNLYKDTLNAIPTPIWVRNEDLNISWCNKAYTNVVDDSKASIIAEQKELKTRDKNKKSGNTKILAQRALLQKKEQSEKRYVINKGERKYFNLHEIPTSSNNSIIGCAIDITEEENLINQIKHISKSNNEALEHLSTAISIFDKNTNLEFHNSAYEQLWGLDSAWLNTYPKITDIIDKLRNLRKIPEHSDFRVYKKSWLERFTKIFKAEEEMIYLPDGRSIRRLIMPRPMGGLLITFEDVTKRVELETSYNQLMAVQKETLDNLQEGLALFGGDGKLKLWNPKLASIWNIEPEILDELPHINKMVDSVQEFFDPNRWEGIKENLIQNVVNREERNGRIYRRDGTILQYMTIPLPDGNILNAYSDVTDSAKVEDALREKNKALEEAEKLKLDFLANVSYQLRTPLNAMLGFAEILNNQYFGSLNDRQLEYTTGMIQSGTKLTSLIDDILDLTTIDAGYFELSKQEFYLIDVINSVVEITQNWARQQDIQFTIDSSDKILINGDKTRIKQVLLNLISNAINFSHKKGIITIFSEENESEVILGVKDEGVGINSKDLTEIFSPFARGKDQQSSAGLGLSLVKSIVELHDGKVEIKSATDEGTTVYCHFNKEI